MGGSRVVLGAAALAAACASPPPMDLSANEQLYRQTGYTASVAAEQPVFVAPVVDRREARAEEASGPLPVVYLPETRWARPLVVQIDRVLRDEVEASGVFAALLAAPAEDAPILQVELQRADAAIEENVSGRRTFGAVQLEVRVLGPIRAGERPVLIEETVAAEKSSRVAIKPPSPRVLLGMALREAMAKLLLLLDQENAGRAGIPGRSP